MSQSYEAPPRRPFLFPPFIVLVFVFAAGVFLERNGWIPGGNDKAPAESKKTFKIFWEAWNAVKDNYVDRSKVDDKKMTQGAIVGMLESLGDRGHTTYMTKEEFERTNEELSGKMEGIGARIGVRHKKPTIVQTMPKSPARTAGLKVGDVLQTVDGQPIGPLSLSQLVNKVRGPAGTNVTLTVQREGETASREFVVRRAKVDVPEVSWQILPGELRVAHLTLQRFSQDSGKQMKAALKDLQEAGAQGVVLDIRGNAGGFKKQCIEVASEFLPEGTPLFIQIDAKHKEEEIKAVTGGGAYDLPVVCLIDGGSASSSEILAGALQDNHRAKLVGTKTFGTGTVLRETKLSDGSAVRLAIYQWLTPQRREIWHKGILPDQGLEVKQPADGIVSIPDPDTPMTEADLQKSTDAQMLEGIKVLRQQIDKGER